MTFEVGDEVIIAANGYDENDEDPFTFTGLLAKVVQLSLKNPDGPLYYVCFSNPKVNGWYGEPQGTAWPFYEHELELARAA